MFIVFEKSHNSVKRKNKYNNKLLFSIIIMAGYYDVRLIKSNPKTGLSSS